MDALVKLKAYRLMRLLSLVQVNSVFNDNKIISAMKKLEPELERLQDHTESEFQKEVEKYLKSK
jgi:hypothetical protein